MTGLWQHLWLRLRGFLLDYLLLLGYLLLLAAGGLLLTLVAPDTGWGNPLLSQAASFLTLTLPVILYFGLCEGGGAQATWGKRRMGLRVETVQGAPPGVARALLRAAGKLLPWELSHTLLWRIEGWPLAPAEPSPAIWAGFGVVWLLVFANLGVLLLTPERRTLYDMIAGTRVVASPRAPGATRDGRPA